MTTRISFRASAIFELHLEIRAKELYIGGLFLSDDGRYDEAFIRFQAALECMPEQSLRTEILYARAQTSMRCGLNREAFHDLNDAIHHYTVMDELKGKILYLRGHIYGSFHNFQLATLDFSNALLCNPLKPELRITLVFFRNISIIAQENQRRMIQAEQTDLLLTQF